jgi:predicted DNA-binding protein
VPPLSGVALSAALLRKPRSATLLVGAVLVRGALPDLGLLSGQDGDRQSCYTGIMKKAITVRLDPADYERLEAEAKRLGMSPGTLARDFVRDCLKEIETGDERKRRALEVLDRLEKLRAELRRAGYPAVDAVKLVREGREELEQRPAL